MSEPALRKNSKSLPRIEPEAVGASCARTGADGYRERRRRRSLEQAAVIQNADDARADEQQRHFGLKDDGNRQADGRDRPLQPVFHAELGEPVAGMKDQRDDGRD